MVGDAAIAMTVFTLLPFIAMCLLGEAQAPTHSLCSRMLAVCAVPGCFCCRSSVLLPLLP